MAKNSPGSKEKRRSPRRPVLDTFSVFVVVPSKGMHRLPVHDLSEHGMGFDLDTEGENFADHPLKQGDRLEVHFYLNQSLYLPLNVELVRLQEAKGVRQVGAQFTESGAKGHQAYLAFLQMLDQLEDVAQVKN
jgi:hypothetical protein